METVELVSFYLGLMFICDMVFYLMPAAFTALQTGQNLTLDGLDPRISFILT